MRFSGAVILLLIFLTACDSRRVYEYDQEYKDRSWRAADTAAFEFTIKDVSKKYNLLYNVRNTLEFPYSRLFVRYDLKDSAGSVLQQQLVSSFLFDQKTGKPFGTSGLGDVYDHQFPLLNLYEFKRPGKYRVRLQQFMRTDTLKGILAAGLRVEEAEK